MAAVIHGHRSGFARKRSTGRLPTSDPQDYDRGSDEGWDTSSSSKPYLQTLFVIVCCCAGLFWALQLTAPRARSASRPLGQQQQLRCFPLDDKDKVKLLGPQNDLAALPIGTASAGAQTLFNLGLLQLYGFNQHEATIMFQAALRYDPGCAMCHWGLAHALGPFPNKVPGKLGDKYPVFDPTAAHDAIEHIRKAQLSSDAAEVALGHSSSSSGSVGGGLDRTAVARDKQLIHLSVLRFEGGVKAVKHGDWISQERRYADAMAKLAHDLEPQVADAYALAAEAFMNLVAWDYYDPVSLQLKGAAAAAEELVLKALQLNPRNLLALHLHIHLAEAGVAGPQVPGAPPAAGRALGSAQALAGLKPQQGHLIHMPSHVLVRVGDYAGAVEVNKRAYDFDLARASHCMVPYLPEHNVNMLIYAASMAGQHHTAEAYATGVRNLRERLPDMWMAKGDEWVSLPLLWARYGDWEPILKMQPPPKTARGVTRASGYHYSRAVYHYVRVLALAAKATAADAAVMEVEDVRAIDLLAKSAKQQHKAVSKELQQLKDAATTLPAERPTRPGAGVGIYASSYTALAQIHVKVAEARVALLSNNTAAAAEYLQDAISMEDGLGYMEPPRLAAPVRPCLGWVRLRQGHWQSARSTFQQDLAHHYANGWSLLGLQRALQAALKQSPPDKEEALREELQGVQQQLSDAWKHAEVQLHSCCPALSQPWTL